MDITSGHATKDRRIDANVTQMILTHNLNFNLTLNLNIIQNLKQDKFLKYLLISSEKIYNWSVGGRGKAMGDLT